MDCLRPSKSSKSQTQTASPLADRSWLRILTRGRSASALDTRSSSSTEHRVAVTIERVPYDAQAVAREVAAVGLPTEYADKLLIAA